MNKKIKVMVNGLSEVAGKMARMVVERLLADERFEVLPYSLTGVENYEDFETLKINNHLFMLIPPSAREKFMDEKIKKEFCQFLSVDYTLPAAVNDNAEFYRRHDLPTVIGTTGGDRTKLEETVKGANVPMVVSPNMSVPINIFMAQMEFAAKNFPNAFKGYSWEIIESHQAKKEDPSGTAIKIGDKYLNPLGLEFNFKPEYFEKGFRKIRNEFIQREFLHIPKEHLDGHAYHTYRIKSPDGSVTLEYQHNVLGRQTYVDGTILALEFLAQKVQAGEKGYYDMIDVMKGVGGV